MVANRPIRPKDILRDIRAGLTDDQLMEKYSISPEALQRLARRMLAERTPWTAKLQARALQQDGPFGTVQRRQLPRYYSVYWIPVYDESRREIGTLGDISEKGLRVDGCEADINDKRTLIVGAEEVPGAQSFQVETICRWVKWSEANREKTVGFEITGITAAARRNLRKFIAALIVSEHESV
ncbi:PilZ domain-containing protein [Thermodesulfobacteriota bacterium]